MWLFVAYPLAALLRLWLMGAKNLNLVERVEFATPLNSYKRLVEGLTLMDNGVDPYSGAVFHETPLALHSFKWVRQNLGVHGFDWLLVIADLISALILGSLAEMMVTRLQNTQEKKLRDYHEDAKNHLMLDQSEDKVKFVTQLTYLFHPYLVANCAAKTTTTFSNLVFVIFLWAAVKKRRTLACFALAFAAYQTFYPVMLLIPLILFLTDPGRVSITNNIIPTLVTFMTFFGFLNYVSFLLMGGKDWGFIYSTHGFTLSVPELTPNMGLFWYFYAEMFEHFRLFFVWTLQLNCFVYVLPLSIQLKDEPFFLSWILISLTAIFKSYPSYGDVGFYLAILPIFSHLFPYMKQLFVAGNMFVAATILGPVLHQMWIYNGSANSNYFFAINLVFGMAQILLVTDVLFSHMKREFYLKNGFKHLGVNTQDHHKGSKLVLQ